MVEYEEVEWDIKYDGEDFNVPLDSVHLMGQIWKPEGDPKFVYVFVHGLAVFITFKKDFFKEGGSEPKIKAMDSHLFS